MKGDAPALEALLALEDAATATGAADGAADAEAAVRRQVSAQLADNAAAIADKGTLRLHLSPPELGKVEVTFVREGRELRVEFHAESETAARALKDGRSELNTALMHKGGDWDRVKISVTHEEDADHEEGGRDRDGKDGRHDRREGQDQEGARG